MFEEEGYALMGAVFEVYNTLGAGFLEEVYQEALELELHLRSIPLVRQPELHVHYKGYTLTKYYRPDLYVFDGIVVELKSCKTLDPNHEAQLFNYLKATQKPVGYLINFGSPQALEWKRIILT